MKYVIKDQKYHFATAFDTKTGTYVRTGILNEHGVDTGIDPFMASFPHLIDVGVMGHCIHGKTGLCVKAGIGCYQNGLGIVEDNMSLDDFTWICKQCQGRCNQLALGGRGDPDQHENFEELLKITRKYDLVPNFTTSGYGMTKDIAKICKKYCGAVAVSWYRSKYTLDAIQMLLEAGVKTNIHYVVGNNTIDEAIERLEKNNFPKGINAVIFLLHKPVGLGKKDNMLSVTDEKVKKFFRLIDKKHPFKIGMDSCNVPGAINFCRNIMLESLDTCEAARYSCYIGPNMKMVPCSFDKSKKNEIQLRPTTIEEAWNSNKFNEFRKKLLNSCPNCKIRNLCMGGCPLMPEIVLCERKEKENENKN